ncbi:hypothetical protein ACGFNP_15690 [Nonomuraea sp. NPDC049269]
MNDPGHGNQHLPDPGTIVDADSVTSAEGVSLHAADRQIGQAP